MKRGLVSTGLALALALGSVNIAMAAGAGDGGDKGSGSSGGTDKASSSAASDRSSGGGAGNSDRNTFNSDRGSNHDKSVGGARYGRYAYGACTNYHRVHTSHGWVRVCIR